MAEKHHQSMLGDKTLEDTSQKVGPMKLAKKNIAEIMQKLHQSTLAEKHHPLTSVIKNMDDVTPYTPICIFI